MKVLFIILFCFLSVGVFAQTNNNNQSKIKISPQYGLSYCQDLKIEINLEAYDSTIKDPIFKLFSTSTPDTLNFNLNSKEVKLYESKFYFDSDILFSKNSNFSTNYPYVYLKEMKSGKVSNIIGPFSNSLPQKTIPYEQAYEIIKNPGNNPLLEGDTAVYEIKNKTDSKIFWYKDGVEIPEYFNKEKLSITKAGKYEFKLSYTNSCLNVFNENAFYVQKGFLYNLFQNNLITSFCGNKVRLTILFYSDFYKKKELIFNWKKQDKIIARTKENNFYVSEIGQYSCEVIYRAEKSETSISTIKNFNGTNNLLFDGLPYDGKAGYRTYCERNDKFNLNLTNAQSFIYNSFNFLNNNYFNKDSLKYNWFINDILQESHEPILKLIAENDKINLRLQIAEGECIYLSDKIETQIRNPGYKFPRKKYEFCDGEVAKFYEKSKLSGYLPALNEKNDWYKDGKLYYTGHTYNRITGIDNFEMNTSEPGKYYFKKSYAKLGQNLLPIYDENGFPVYDTNCLITSDTIEIIFKKEIKLRNSLYFVDDYANTTFIRQLCSPTQLKLNFKGELKSYSWHFEDERIADSLTWALSKQIGTKLDKAGNYYAKLNLSNNCTVVSDSVYYNGKPNFNLFTKNLCENPVIGVEYNLFSDNQNQLFDFLFKVNDNMQASFGSGISINRSGTYTAYAISKDGKCKLESNSLKVELPFINYNLNFADSLKICDGKAVELILADTTNNKLINWYKNGELIKENNFKLPINTLGIYKALFKNKICDRYNFSEPVEVLKLPLSLPTATISGGGYIDYGKTTDLKFELTSQEPWEVGLNTGEKFTINKSPHTISVKPLSDIKYSIASLKNICGEGTSSGEANIKVIILAEEQDLESNMALKVFPIPVLQNCEIEIIDAFSKNCVVKLYDALGKVILTEQLNFENTKANKTLALSNLPSGTYTLKVQIGTKTTVRKLVK